MCCILMYLGGNIEELLEQKQVHFVSALLTFLVFIITCQDIAVDSWAVEMLHPDHGSYGSSSQSTGQTLGYFISSTVFMALSSTEMCQSHLYTNSLYLKFFTVPLGITGEPEPLLTVPNFVYMWACF